MVPGRREALKGWLNRSSVFAPVTHTHRDDVIAVAILAVIALVCWWNY